MTREQVKRAVATAVTQAFRMGQAQLKHFPRAAEEQRQVAEQYAEQLVMPMVELAIEQAREEGASAALAARQDPEPGDV